MPTSESILDLNRLFTRPMIWYSRFPEQADSSLRGSLKFIIFKDGRALFTERPHHSDIVFRTGLRDNLLSLLRRPWLCMDVEIGCEGLNSVSVDEMEDRTSGPPEWWTENAEWWTERLTTLAVRVLSARRVYEEVCSSARLVYGEETAAYEQVRASAWRDYVNAISSIEGYVPDKMNREQESELTQEGGENQMGLFETLKKGDTGTAGKVRGAMQPQTQTPQQPPSPKPQ